MQFEIAIPYVLKPEMVAVIVLAAGSTVLSGIGASCPVSCDVPSMMNWVSSKPSGKPHAVSPVKSK